VQRASPTLSTSPSARSKAAAWALSASLVDTLLGIVLGTRPGRPPPQGPAFHSRQEPRAPSSPSSHRGQGSRGQQQEEGQEEGLQREQDGQQQQQRWEGQEQHGETGQGQGQGSVAGIGQGELWESADLPWGGMPLRYQVLGLLVHLACPRSHTLGQSGSAARGTAPGGRVQAPPEARHQGVGVASWAPPVLPAVWGPVSFMKVMREGAVVARG